jgi:hypothetical protein
MAEIAFHPFPKLSAELRLRVWHFTIENEPQKEGRIIAFHSYDPSANIISVAISSRYSALFHVNREARYESVKQFTGELVTVQMGYSGAGTSSNKFELFIDFKKDTVFLSERFS